jgi:hypothetical protein
VQGVRTPVTASNMAVMPFLMAIAPVLSGRVSAFALRSNAAVEEERRGERPGPMLKRLGRGGSIDLMPKCRFGGVPFRGWRRERGRRKGGGSWIAIVIEVFGGIVRIVNLSQQRREGLRQHEG